MTTGKTAKRVGVLCGGRSAEHKASLTSARAVLKGLALAGFEVRALGIAKDGSLVDESTVRAALKEERSELPRGERPFRVADLVQLEADVVFPLLFGELGCDDGSVQALCRWLDVPCVGPSAASASVMFDKAVTKAVLTAASVPTLPAVTLRGPVTGPAEEAALEGLSFPVFVKPATLGCSIGCAKASDAGELRQAIEAARPLSSSVLVEPFKKVRELAVGVLTLRGELRTTQPGETRPPGEFYDYWTKIVHGGAAVTAPAEVAPQTAARAQALAAAAFRAVGGTGMARVDIFCSEDESSLWVNELQPYPCIAPACLFPWLWQLGGMPYPALLTHLVEEAVYTHGVERARVEASARLDLEQPPQHAAAGG